MACVPCRDNGVVPESENNLRLEIRHVLFIDLVGYSKLLIEEQKKRMGRLTEIVRATSQVAKSTDEQLVRLPTGDGMALVFRNSAEEPACCAIEIAQALKAHPEVMVRMGIHSGPVSEVTDVAGRVNLAGAGINMAQRVMDCGDAGHILLSRHVAEDLEQYSQWRPQLHDLGECEVKHGVRMSVVNLYGDQVGNAALPKKFQILKKRGTRVRWTAIGAALLALAAIVAGTVMFSRYRMQPTVATPEKSIAVLPFENLSEDKANAYFADGIQDDILTAISKISDLKVISRSSVMRYRGTNLDVRQIARDLNVANVLEGSVRRVGDEIRVTAQLIDARTDTHLWAEHYDRKTSDVFAIQSEVAENIATQLQAALSPAEKAAISVRPTADLEAFDLFLQARDLIRTFNETPNAKKTLIRAIRLLDEAIVRDPKFALAYCWAAIAHDNLYWFNYDHAATRLELAESCVRQALQISPDLGEAHVAQALVFYHGHRDYARAREQLAIARQSLPNNAEVFSLTGYIDRREGKWDDALRNLERAAELDPRNFKVLSDLSVLYDLLRRYDDKEKLYDRIIAINPAQTDYWQLLRASTELEKGNLAKARQFLEKVPQQYDPNGAGTSIRIALLLYEGNPEAAQSALDACKQDALVDNTGSLLPRSFFAGQIARARNDWTGAVSAFNTARDEIGQKLRDDPYDALLHGVLCVIDAGLGQREESLSEGNRAVQLRPISKDAVDGPVVLTRLAMAYAWMDENDAAIERLTYLARIPSGPDYGQLKFDPAWDPLRGDPRFEKIVASLAPK